MNWFLRKHKRCRNAKGKYVILYSIPKDYDLICSRFLSPCYYFPYDRSFC